MTMQMGVAVLSLSFVLLVGQAAEIPMPAASHHVRSSPVLLTIPEAAMPDDANMAVAVEGNATKVPNVFKYVAKVIENELVNNAHPRFTAAVALIGGLACVFKGKEFFEFLICIIVGYVSGVLVMGSVGDLWHLPHKSSLRRLVGWEAGILACVGAYKGKNGMNVFGGVALGMWFTYYLQHILVHLGVYFLSTDEGAVAKYYWEVAIFYTVFAGGFLWMFVGKAHIKLLALITPFIGGILTASAIAFFCTSLALWGPVSKPLQNKFQLHPVGGPWVQFLMMLSSPETADVGIFANSPFNKFGEKWTIDRLAGFSLWLIFWVVGVIVQWKKAKVFTAPQAQMRELPLQQPLIEPAVE